MIMAQFERDDLIDLIRWTFRNEDDTGLCRKVVASPRRQKSPPGRLPFDFGEQNAMGKKDEEEDEEGENGLSSPVYLAPSREPSPLKNPPRPRPRKPRFGPFKDPNDEESMKVKKIDQEEEDPPSTSTLQRIPTIELFTFTRPPSIVPSTVTLESTVPLESIASEILNRSSTVFVNPFAEFAQFEAVPGSNEPQQAQVLIIVPFGDARVGDCYGCSLKVNVKRNARISDLVGLICFLYTKEQLTPSLSSNSTDYHLLIADESGEVDFDLPPISAHETMWRIGFTAMALERKSEEILEQVYILNVSTTQSDRFEIECPSLDVNLKWLRDEALRLRWLKYPETMENQMNKKYFRPTSVNEYILEALHEPGVALDLDKAIDTTGVFEFFLLRKNSSRGYAKKTRFESDADLLSESSSPTPTSPKRLSPLPSPTLPNHEQLFVSASPRTQSVIRSHTLDVTPVDAKRKSLKLSSIPWDYLAGIDMPENQKPHAAHRLLRVFWLPVPSICSNFFEQSMEHRDSICSDDGAHTDAHARAVRVSELIDRRQSVVRQIFRHSAIGTRSPRLAASTAGLLEPGQWKNRRRRRDTGPGPIRKASVRVSRMLSNRRATSD